MATAGGAEGRGEGIKCVSESGGGNGLRGARTLDRPELGRGAAQDDVLGADDKVEHLRQAVEHQVEAARAQAEEAVVMDVRRLEHDTGAEEA